MTNMLNPTANTILINNNIKTSITYRFSVNNFYSKISVLKIELHIESVKLSGYASNALNHSNYGKIVVEPFGSVFKTLSKTIVELGIYYHVKMRQAIESCLLDEDF
jgi:hypothetical protein